MACLTASCVATEGDDGNDHNVASRTWLGANSSSAKLTLGDGVGRVQRQDELSDASSPCIGPGSAVEKEPLVQRANGLPLLAGAAQRVSERDPVRGPSVEGSELP